MILWMSGTSSLHVCMRMGTSEGVQWATGVQASLTLSRNHDTSYTSCWEKIETNVLTVIGPHCGPAVKPTHASAPAGRDCCTPTRRVRLQGQHPAARGGPDAHTSYILAGRHCKVRELAHAAALVATGGADSPTYSMAPGVRPLDG